MPECVGHDGGPLCLNGPFSSVECFQKLLNRCGSKTATIESVLERLCDGLRTGQLEVDDLSSRKLDRTEIPVVLLKLVSTDISTHKARKF